MPLDSAEKGSVGLRRSVARDLTTTETRLQKQSPLSSSANFLLLPASPVANMPPIGQKPHPLRMQRHPNTTGRLPQGGAKSFRPPRMESQGAEQGSSHLHLTLYGGRIPPLVRAHIHEINQ
jgi:hypothetical protein